MKPSVSISTSVGYKVFARKSLYVKTLMGALSVSVTLVLEVIFAMTLTSATKPVLVTQMQNVRILKEASNVLATQATVVTE